MNVKVEEIHWTNGPVGIRLVLSVYCGGYLHKIQFDRPNESKMERDFLIEAIEDQYREHIEEIRRAAYNAGWRDKTKRRKKQQYHGYCPDSVDPY